MTPEVLIAFCALLGGGVGAYAAVRSDLARTHERATSAKEMAKDARDSLTDHINLHHVKPT